VKDEEDTKDVLAEAFIKIFQHVKNFDFHDEVGLEAWLKRIVVNQSLMFLRKNRNLVRAINIEDNHLLLIAPVEIELHAEDLYKLILELPLGYRTVFNLYVIEGYSHKEIAEQLTISESASRSQLTHARQRLMTLLSKNT
jgi:RNA polymerase sigma-70 factor (ECF subfamily)